VPLPVELRLDYRGLAATVPMRGRAQIAPQEMPLAGYLLARALDSRKVDGDDLERLRRADESVRETRALLAVGRGNVRQDNDLSQGQASIRVDAARTLKLGSRSVEARAIWAGAGNCGEHASLASVVHASRLHAESKEAVLLLGNVLIDHGWAESVVPRPWQISSLRKPDDRAIVLDAWKDGPAVFATDSTRTQAQRIGAITFRNITAPRPELLAEAKAETQRIASMHDPRSFSAPPLPRWLQTNAKTVINSAFMERVMLKLDPGPAASGLPAGLQARILATAVARELMAPPEPLGETTPGHGRVRAAAKQAPAIVGAARELAKTTARREQPWMPQNTIQAGPSPDEPRLVRRPTSSSKAG